MLAEFDNIAGRGDELVGKLGDVHKTVLMNTDVHECSECGDIGNKTGQNHANAQVLNLVYIGIERECLCLLARVEAAFVERVHNIGEGWKSNLVGHITGEFDFLAQFGIGNELFKGDTAILCHFDDYIIRFGMYGGVVERIVTANHAQETCGLLKCLVAKTWHIEQFLTGAEIAIGCAIFHDILGQDGAKTRDMSQYLFGCGIDIHTYFIHAALDNNIKAVLELGLVDTMLVLPHSNGTGFYLDKLGERVNETATNGYSPTHGNILVGELLACDG